MSTSRLVLIATALVALTACGEDGDDANPNDPSGSEPADGEPAEGPSSGEGLTSGEGPGPSAEPTGDPNDPPVAGAEPGEPTGPGPGSMGTGGTPGSQGGGDPADPGDPNEPDPPMGEPGPSLLPTDADVFGDKVVAMYILREAYVTISGDPPVVTSVVNAAAPGVGDVTFDNPPAWIADCGTDASGESYGCARFDGADDYGEGHGFTLETGDRPSLIAVLRMNDLGPYTSIPFQITDTAGAQFMNLVEIPSGQSVWRYNGSLEPPPHNIDFGTPDLGLHLHEHHLAHPTLAIFDGVTQPETGGNSGLGGPATMVSLGRRAPADYASVDIFEALVVDQPTLEEAANYRELRIRAQYPGITLP